LLVRENAIRPIGSVKPATKGKTGARREASVAALVPTVTVTMPPCKPSRLTVLGEGAQLDCGGAPVLLMVTVPVKPPRGRTGMLKVPELPAFRVREFALGVNEKSTTVRTTYCGLPVPL